MNEDIMKALELKEGADVLAAVKSLKDTASKLKDSEDEIKRLKEQIETLKPKGDEVRLKESEYKMLKDGAETAIKLQEQMRKSEVEGMVEKAISEGKVAPAQKDAMVKIGLSDKDALQAVLRDAQPIIGFKEKGSGGEGKPDSNPKIALTEQINKIVTEKKVSFSEASRMLRKEKPELFEGLY